MKVYLAAPYQWKDRIIERATELRSLEIEVTSSWLEEPHKPSTTLSELTDEQHAQYALRDLQDINEADILILFAVPSTDTPIPRAGRHVEFGYALAARKSVWLVGNKENIFHYLPQIRIFETWADAVQELIFRSNAILGR